MALHQPHHVRQRGTFHDAVGVQHDHVAIPTAPASAEILQIAALAVGVLRPVAVENPSLAVQRPHHVLPAQFLLDPHVGIAGVAEDEEIEVRQATGFRQRAMDGAQAGKYSLRILVVDRHQDRGARRRHGRVGRRGRLAGNRPAVAAEQNREKPHERRPERHADPADQNRVQQQQQQLHRTETVALEHADQQSQGDQRGQVRQQKECPSPEGIPLRRRSNGYGHEGVFSAGEETPRRQ